MGIIRLYPHHNASMIQPNKLSCKGFTLIELSIVLVIIGLIAGGVLVGRDLIAAATIRAQISQIEKYQTAVNTFRGKYGYLPGDIPSPVADQYGFVPRGSQQGQGDGNGSIQSFSTRVGWATGVTVPGEPVMFWVDLSAANLIDGGFNTATPTQQTPDTPQMGMSAYFPTAKIGRQNNIYVWSGGWNVGLLGTGDEKNYFGIEMIYQIYNTCCTIAVPSLTVQEAYNIDKKIDDGFPQSGKVLALYAAYGNAYWAINTGLTLIPMPPYTSGGSGTYIPSSPPYSTATSWTSANCFDNGGTAGVQTYSLAQNSDSVNCALSFEFQ
jgi:prepilin-type N-terminal cleavage/methylation domain-containing protein